MNSVNRYCLILCLIFSYSLQAGENGNERKNIFTVHLGLCEYQTKEGILNKALHRGMFPSLDFAYGIQGDETMHNLQLSFIFNPLQSSYESEAATFASNVALNYVYLQNMTTLSHNTRLSLGGTTGADYNIAYYENWDESHFYWLTSYYIGFNSRLTYNRTDGAHITLDMQLPLLALVSRPPDRFLKSEVDPQFSAIVNNLHDNLEWATLNRHFEIKLNLAYTFAGPDNLIQSLYWRFRYLNNDMTYSKKIKILTHSLGIVFSF